jgi:hypothetical protein
MCNIWVILRRNVMYFIVKKLILINFFTVKISSYDVNRWIFGTKNKGKKNFNSPNDIISAHFDIEKVDQDGIFYYKDILHFFFEWPKYYTYQKSYLWLLALKVFALIPPNTRLPHIMKRMNTYFLTLITAGWPPSA